jgi:hypothetical protein
MHASLTRVTTSLMRTLVVLAIVLTVCVGCGGPKPKRESSFVPEGSDTSDHCCCKSTPITSEDGQPEFEIAGRIECSTKQGECVPDVQCTTAKP